VWFAQYLAVIVGAYVLGSIPTGAIVARIYRNVDLTKIGSERTGATNTARALGPGAGLVVLVGDFAKGALAVWLAGHLAGQLFNGADYPFEGIRHDARVGLAGLFAVIGHTKSVFLGGKGGRGVVTGLGGLAFASTGLFGLAAVTGTVVAAGTRFISLGSICGAIAALVGALVAGWVGVVSAILVAYVVVTAAYVIVAHADNIARLRAGTERRVGSGSS
jgi:glycerol-3-phosphate acyltransferase PlsY